VRVAAKTAYPVFFGDDAYVSSENPRFSAANAAIRISVWNQKQFNEEVIASEDQIWAKHILDAGYQIAYQPKSVVYHSHTDSFTRYYNRIVKEFIELRAYGLLERERTFRTWLSRQWKITRNFLSSIKHNRKVKSFHWDTFRVESVANWAWYRAGVIKANAFK
jgi:GT2 family glycosyltransferase